MAYNELKRRENAIMTAEKLVDTLKRLLGENHIRVFWAALDALDYVIYNQGGQSAYFPPDVQQAFMLLPQVHEELRAALGDRHPVTIRALTLHGQGLARAQQIPEASETLRRALAISEDALGPDHPQTMDIVGSIGAMYTLQGGLPFSGMKPATEAIPWLVRYLNWVEQRKGIDNPEAITSFEMLGNIHLAAKQYQPAQRYFERALAACRGTQDAAVQERISISLQLCQVHTSILNSSGGMGSGLGNFLSQLQRF